jgi:DNA polymerase-3 subunit epsilon
MVSLDLETTGVSVEDDRVVTATLIEIKPGHETVTHNWLVDPQIPVPDGAAAVHGVTSEQAQAEGVHPVEALTEITARLAATWSPEVPLIIYNAPYDTTLLDRDLRRNGLGGLKLAGPIVDPLCIDKAVDRYRKGKRTLTAACERYGVVLEDAHTSAADALAAARVAWKMAESVPELREFTLAELHEAQCKWYAEQQASFADYLRRQAAKAELDERVELMARAAGITGEWPMTPLPVEAEVA